MALAVLKMNRARRRIRHFAILRGKIIRRKKSREQNERVESRQKRTREREFVTLRQFITPCESADRPQKAAYPQENSPPPGKPTRASPFLPPRKYLSPESPPPAKARSPASSKSLPRATPRSASSQSKIQIAKSRDWPPPAAHNAKARGVPQFRARAPPV